MKNLKTLYIIVMMLVLSVCTSAFSINFKKSQSNEVKKDKVITLNHRLFSLSLPSDLCGVCESEINKKGVFIYDKEAKKAGFGGYAFGIIIFKTPAEHSMIPGCVKIGELKKGRILYDVVLSRPTDVQYDYRKEISDSYSRLYKLADNVEIKGRKSAVYLKNHGMKGENLYKDVLKKYITAINEKWDSAKLEKENMSCMYNVLSKSGENLLDRIGYAYYDVNADGVEELLIGEITDGEQKGIIYDLYTMVDRKPVHVFSGWNRNRYYVTDDVFLMNERMLGAGENLKIVYILLENSTELFPQVGFKYDEYTDKNKPWYVSYNLQGNEWKNVSEKFYKERISTFCKYTRFNYTPLSKFK